MKGTKADIFKKMMMKFFRVAETGSMVLKDEILLDDDGLIDKYNFDTESIARDISLPCWRGPTELAFVEKIGSKKQALMTDSGGQENIKLVSLDATQPILQPKEYKLGADEQVLQLVLSSPD